jgi:dTDP-4-amino-4,6-dideoxygalactose transaminase
MQGIFDREYYTNHGPVVQELEARLEATLGVRHALTVTNATVGLYLVARALGLEGAKVILPAFTFIATAQALSWAGAEVLFCDVDLATHHLSNATLDRALRDDVDAVVGVNLWGGACEAAALGAWAVEHGAEVFFDSAQAFGCTTSDRPIGGFGQAEVFSFHATKVLSATEGGCITTNNDELAERIRNMRSNYGIRSAREVSLTINARMSEAQAAVALLSLEDLAANVSHNVGLRESYHAGLGSVPGLVIRDPVGVVSSNSQYLVCEVDEREFGMSRDVLLRVLAAEGVAARRYHYPGVHRTMPYCDGHGPPAMVLAATDELCGKIIQLPVGARVGTDDVARISAVIEAAHAFGPTLRAEVEGTSAGHARMHGADRPD